MFLYLWGDKGVEMEGALAQEEREVRLQLMDICFLARFPAQACSRLRIGIALGSNMQRGSRSCNSGRSAIHRLEPSPRNVKTLSTFQHK